MGARALLRTEDEAKSGVTTRKRKHVRVFSTLISLQLTQTGWRVLSRDGLRVDPGTGEEKVI
jgi:hypothetical protein